MSELVVTIYGDAQPAGSKKAIPTATGPRVIDDARKSAPWKKHVAQVAGQQMAGRELMAGPLYFIATFYRPRPKGHFGKRGVRPAAPPYPITKPDVLKLARAAEDALTGVVYRDDAQIVLEVLRKEYGEPARVELAIGPMQNVARKRSWQLAPRSAEILTFPTQKGAA